MISVQRGVVRWFRVMARRLVGFGVFVAACGAGELAEDVSTTSTSPFTSTSTSYGSSSDKGSSGDTFPDGFEPAPCDDEPDVLADRLCDEGQDPETANDEIYIHCRNESACQGPADPPGVDTLRVMAWNIERGMTLDAQLAAFTDGTLPAPDVILMGEVDRGCTRSGDRNVAWEYAAALGMHHAYGVEFVELPRPGEAITAPCEHGNAILSRFPIGNVELVRHAVNESWFATDEPRLGGRMALVADLAVGDRIVQVAVVHFESGAEDGPKRAAQAAEIADIGAMLDRPVIIGGDTNAGLYAFDLYLDTHNEATTEAFFDRGYADAHEGLPSTARTTKPPALVLDLIMLKGATPSMPIVCEADICDGLSDHRAVWVDVVLGG